jgi:hypothetical protein
MKGDHPYRKEECRHGKGKWLIWQNGAKKEPEPRGSGSFTNGDLRRNFLGFFLLWFGRWIAQGLFEPADAFAQALSEVA